MFTAVSSPVPFTDSEHKVMSPIALPEAKQASPPIPSPNPEADSDSDESSRSTDSNGSTSSYLSTASFRAAAKGIVVDDNGVVHSRAGSIQTDDEAMDALQLDDHVSEAGKMTYRRVPKFWTYGSACCACAQRSGLPRQSFLRTLRSQKT
jgi:hypothetical protein